MSDPAKIAAGLTEAQRRAVRALSDAWLAGPNLPPPVIDARALPSLREAGLVEREFGDMGAPEYGAGADSISVHVSACWHFRLTPLGLAVRKHLQESKP